MINYHGYHIGVEFFYFFSDRVHVSFDYIRFVSEMKNYELTFGNYSHHGMDYNFKKMKKNTKRYIYIYREKGFRQVFSKISTKTKL